jgi:hypothetical protein
MFGYNKNVLLSLIVVNWLYLNIGIEKYADFPLNRTVHSYCNTTTCFGPL